MKYLAVLGRQPEISIAELEALGIKHWTSVDGDALSREVNFGRLPICIVFSFTKALDINKLGGVLKLAVKLEQKPLNYLQELPGGKITIGVSDYSKNVSSKTAFNEALKLKKILVRHGRSVRIVESRQAVLSSATSLHNGLSGNNERKVELIRTNDEWYRVIGVQDIDSYAKRDQARPARDAKVGLLPPKLAQILINMCGSLPENSVILDPFCGTGVVLQEALLMGYRAYGTDINERMIDYSNKNLKWLDAGSFELAQGDATTYEWRQPIDAVACEGYLGRPFATIPSEMELKKEKQECGTIVTGFLKNLVGQIGVGVPVTIAVPAWLRNNRHYERLEILDEIVKLGYNVDNKTREGLLYHRDGQVVARDILILRKK